MHWSVIVKAHVKSQYEVLSICRNEYLAPLGNGEVEMIRHDEVTRHPGKYEH